jgi:Na+-transporting NADH:ubiquinone oxidoreductase subunit C
VHSNRYTFIYAAVISVITAVLLAFASEGLRPAQEANVALDKKTSILRSVRITAVDRKTIEQTYAERVKELVVNSKGEELADISTDGVKVKDEIAKPLEQRRLPLYVYTDEHNKKNYIIPMQGVGLWGPIWGYISIAEDFNTVYGAFFDHKSETPGLGAEIAEKPFQEQFQGKKIMGENNNFVSVRVVKKTTKIDAGPEHRVDAISGGTITSTGTDKMLRVCMEPYLGYFEKVKAASGVN